MKITIIILLATIVITGCTCTPDKQCTSTKDPTMITAKVGEEFNITLDANPNGNFPTI